MILQRLGIFSYEMPDPNPGPLPQKSGATHAVVLHVLLEIYCSPSYPYSLQGFEKVFSKQTLEVLIVHVSNKIRIQDA